jgi:hypothetical protein
MKAVRAKRESKTDFVRAAVERKLKHCEAQQKGRRQ